MDITPDLTTDGTKPVTAIKQNTPTDAASAAPLLGIPKIEQCPKQKLSDNGHMHSRHRQHMGNTGNLEIIPDSFIQTAFVSQQNTAH